MPKPQLTWGELQKQLLAEASLLLELAAEVAEENPSQPVPVDRIQQFQSTYDSHPVGRESFESLIERTGRARVSC